MKLLRKAFSYVKSRFKRRAQAPQPSAAGSTLPTGVEPISATLRQAQPTIGTFNGVGNVTVHGGTFVTILGKFLLCFVRGDKLMNTKLHQDSRVTWVVLEVRPICVTETHQSERTMVLTQVPRMLSIFGPLRFISPSL